MQALAAAETSDKLVRLLQSVPRRQLEMARYEAGLGPPPEQPPPTELPLGSRIGDKDGMLECNCKLPVSRWRAKKQGKNKGKWYYRCRDLDVSLCMDCQLAARCYRCTLCITPLGNETHTCTSFHAPLSEYYRCHWVQLVVRVCHVCATIV